MYRMRHYQDSYKKGSKVVLHVQHSIVYVLEGQAKINGEIFDGDTEVDEIIVEGFRPVQSHSATYASDELAIEALEDSIIWRFEIDRTEAKPTVAIGEGVESTMRMERLIRAYELKPGRECLFQLDGLVFQGDTGWHTNQCSGIRVVKSGAMSCRSTWGEESDCDKRGAAWFEEASYPVHDFTPEDGQVSMMRGVVTTADYFQKGAGGYSLDNQSTTLNGRTDYLLYLQQLITLK